MICVSTTGVSFKPALPQPDGPGRSSGWQVGRRRRRDENVQSCHGCPCKQNEQYPHRDTRGVRCVMRLIERQSTDHRQITPFFLENALKKFLGCRTVVAVLEGVHLFLFTL